MKRSWLDGHLGTNKIKFYKCFETVLEMKDHRGKIHQQDSDFKILSFDLQNLCYKRKL
jgi:hypothetical protein